MIREITFCILSVQTIKERRDPGLNVLNEHIYICIYIYDHKLFDLGGNIKGDVFL